MKDSTKSPAIAPKSAKKTSVDFKNASAEPSKNTKLVKKKGAQAGDPTKMAKPSRTNVKSSGGARYGIRVKFQKSVAPEAGATQANGRILTPANSTQSKGFGDGMKDHN